MDVIQLKVTQANATQKDGHGDDGDGSHCGAFSSLVLGGYIWDCKLITALQRTLLDLPPDKPTANSETCEVHLPCDLSMRRKALSPDCIHSFAEL